MRREASLSFWGRPFFYAMSEITTTVDIWKLFDLFEYKVCHSEVKRFHESKAKIKVCVAPRRTTKSYSASRDVLPDIFQSLIRKDDDFRIWIVGPSYSLAEKEFRYLHDMLVVKGNLMNLDKPKVCLTNPRSGQLYMHFQLLDEHGNPEWNLYIEGKTADRPDSLLGEAVDVVIYSEASELPRTIRERYVAPTLNTKKGREIIPTTPSAKAEWVHELYLAGQTGEFPEIETFQWDRTANPLYDEAEFERARKFYGSDSPVFREQYLGEWVFYGGLVYPIFTEEKHIIKPFKIPKDWRVSRSIDFGHRDPFVTLYGAVGPNAEVYICNEYYIREGRALKDHAQAIKMNSKQYNMFDSVGDPSEKQAIEDLIYEGLDCESANNDKTAGRSRVMEYLTLTEDGVPPFGQKKEVGKKYPRLYFFDTCKETLREMRYYRWKEGKHLENEKERTEGEDHAMDALRYLMMTRPSPFRQGVQISRNTVDGLLRQFRAEKMTTGGRI